MSSRSVPVPRSRLRLAYSTVALVLASAVTVVNAPAASALPTGCVYDPSAFSVTCTYGSTGAAQSFVVPAGVSAVRVSLTGGSGGTSRFGFAPGGAGAVVTSTLAVTPGETLQVVVGGVGANGDSPAGGFNGGGGLPQFGGTSRISGSGGGASDIRRGDALAGRVLVAAGGGGAGGCGSADARFCDAVGGSGGAGGVTGAAGENGTSAIAALTGGGGSGGSGISGGAGGSAGAGGSGDTAATRGADGALGQGGVPGAGGAGAVLGGYGGAGGGGYYGGGGGGGGSVARYPDRISGGGGGGGGGSNLVTGSNPVVGTASSAGAGRATITYPFTAAPATITATPSTIDRGGSTTLTATGEDVYGTAAYATSTPGASCSGKVCTSSVKGTFTVTSTFGGRPGPSTTVTVRNTAPVATADSYTTGAGRTLTVAAPGLLANDTDVDGDTLIVAGDVDVSGLQGTAAVNADGSFNVTPAAGFVGTTSFSYSVSDGTGRSNRATVNLTVAPSPTVTATPSTIDRGGSTTLTATGEAIYGPAVFATSTPGASCSGNVCTSTTKGTFTVTSTFGGIAGPSTTVTVRNTAPVATDDSYTTGAGRTLTVAAPGLLANDTDVDGDTLIVASDVDVSGLQGTAAVNADGSFNVTPAAGFVGTTSFSYSVSDGSATSGRATVTLTVAAPPTVTASPSTITAGGSTTLTATGVAVYGPGSYSTSTPGASCSGNVCTSTVAGSFTVSSTFGGVAGPTTTVTVTPGAAAAVVGVSGDGQTAVQGSAFGAPLVAQVLDTYGNQVGAGVPVTFTLPAVSATSGSATFPGGASTATVITGTNGTATSPVVTAGQPGGVTATATTGAAATGATYLLSVTASGPAKADLSVTLSVPTQVSPGGAVTAKVTVTNAGPAAASKVVSGLVLPRGWTVTNAGGAKVLGKQFVVFTTASLASKASVTYTVTLTAAKAKGLTLLAAGTSSGTQDPSYRNNITAALLQVK